MSPGAVSGVARGAKASRIPGPSPSVGEMKAFRVSSLFGRGKAQVCHDLRVEELREQLEVEEEDGDR